MTEIRPLNEDPSSVQAHLTIMQSVDTADGGEQPLLQGVVRHPRCRHLALGGADRGAAARADSLGSNPVVKGVDKTCQWGVDVQRLCQGNGPAIMSVVAVSSQ